MSAPILSTSGSGLQLLLLLYADPDDAVIRVLLERRLQPGLEVLPVPVRTLLEAVTFDPSGWTVGGRHIDPATTAVVNRLPLADRLMSGDGSSVDAQRRIWARLRHELERFFYASSLPTATSILGCRGSLLDQWTDLPRLLPDLPGFPSLRVPAHSTPFEPRELTGDVHTVDRWALYSLGRPRAEALLAGVAPAARLDYVRPPGRLVTLAQVGGSMFFADPPPEMTTAQADTIVGFARALARVSPLRIVEHVFFLAGAAPVFYSTCPVPVISGSHPVYPELVLQGLRDDVEKWGRPPRR